MSIDLHYFSIEKGRFEEILDFLPYPFLISDLRNETYVNLYLNHKFIQEIGYSLNDIPTIDEWFLKAYPHESHRIQVKQQWSDLFSSAKKEGKDFILMKVLIRTKANGFRWYEVKASLFGQMQMVAFVDSHFETIKEKELEIENRNHNITLSILSHDLRSPISNLKSLTEMVLAKQIPSTQFLEMTRKLNDKSQQVLDLLDTTLLWTKTNFDGLRIKMEKVHVADIVKEILTLYEGNYQSKRITITMDIERFDLYSDSEIIKIVLRNLISNAIKFSPPGGEIKVRAIRNEKNKFILSVCDTGIGFDSTLSAQILSDQYAFDHDVRRGHGHGVGLALCRQLLEKLNSRLKIESEVKKGTTVTVIL
jgi:signal transduction histidine kinase